MAAEYETIQYEVRDAVCTITLNRPEVYNAFNETMTAELLSALKTAERDASIRALIITGAGKAFCSGQDLKTLKDNYVKGYVPVLGERLRKGYNPMILKIRSMEKPIIAAVNGVAAGAGCSLALAADLRIMAENATLIEVFVHVGLVPDSGSTYMLPRLVGMGKAFEMCALGDKVGAKEALRLGLTNRVVADDALAGQAYELACRLATLPTKAIGLTKRLLNQAFDHTLEQQLEAEAFVQRTAGETADHFEGVRAFIDKRTPEFHGK
ncbi:MAG: enoyl-CoA hydratase/isomerase family protein [Planctomycetes bacterium]|nr:enoyl-CoA hydratase/isomerase family protein [Planctomycetota bacterium]